MSKVKSKESIEETIQLTSTQIAKAVSEAKKIAENNLNNSAKAKINWDQHIHEFKINPPSSVEDAVTRIVATSSDENASKEHREMIAQMMLSNPAVLEVLKGFVK